jgi:hypothetical protein
MDQLQQDVKKFLQQQRCMFSTPTAALVNAVGTAIRINKLDSGKGGQGAPLTGVRAGTTLEMLRMGVVLVSLAPTWRTLLRRIQRLVQVCEATLRLWVTMCCVNVTFGFLF